MAGPEGGRPLVYRDYFAEMARERCARGAVLLDLAGLFDVERRTVQEWMRKHPEFGQAVRDGRADYESASKPRKSRRPAPGGRAARPGASDEKWALPQRNVTRIVFRYVDPDC